MWRGRGSPTSRAAGKVEGGQGVCGRGWRARRPTPWVRRSPAPPDVAPVTLVESGAGGRAWGGRPRIRRRANRGNPGAPGASSGIDHERSPGQTREERVPQPKSQNATLSRPGGVRAVEAQHRVKVVLKDRGDQRPEASGDTPSRVTWALEATRGASEVARVLEICQAGRSHYLGTSLPPRNRWPESSRGAAAEVTRVPKSPRTPGVTPGPSGSAGSRWPGQGPRGARGGHLRCCSRPSSAPSPGCASRPP